MKTTFALASLLVAAGSPAAITAQFAGFTSLETFIAFIAGYTMTGILAIGVSDYSRKARTSARGARQPAAVVRTMVRPVRADVDPASAWAYQTFSA